MASRRAAAQNNVEGDDALEAALGAAIDASAMIQPEGGAEQDGANTTPAQGKAKPPAKKPSKAPVKAPGGKSKAPAKSAPKAPAKKPGGKGGQGGNHAATKNGGGAASNPQGAESVIVPGNTPNNVAPVAPTETPNQQEIKRLQAALASAIAAQAPADAVPDAPTETLEQQEIKRLKEEIAKVNAAKKPAAVAPETPIETPEQQEIKRLRAELASKVTAAQATEKARAEAEDECKEARKAYELAQNKLRSFDTDDGKAAASQADGGTGKSAGDTAAAANAGAQGTAADGTKNPKKKNDSDDDEDEEDEEDTVQDVVDGEVFTLPKKAGMAMALKRFLKSEFCQGTFNTKAYKVTCAVILYLLYEPWRQKDFCIFVKALPTDMEENIAFRRRWNLLRTGDNYVKSYEKLISYLKKERSRPEGEKHQLPPESCRPVLEEMIGLYLIGYEQNGGLPLYSILIITRTEPARYQTLTPDSLKRHLCKNTVCTLFRSKHGESADTGIDMCHVGTGYLKSNQEAELVQPLTTENLRNATQWHSGSTQAASSFRGGASSAPTRPPAPRVTKGPPAAPASGGPNPIKDYLASLPPDVAEQLKLRCYKCGGQNHIGRWCRAPHPMYKPDQPLCILEAIRAGKFPP